MTALGAKMGFGFSAGLFDMVLNWRISTNPVLVVIVGLAFAVVYYVLFRAVIRCGNYKTPAARTRGRRRPSASIRPRASEQSDAVLGPAGGRRRERGKRWKWSSAATCILHPLR